VAGRGFQTFRENEEALVERFGKEGMVIVKHLFPRQEIMEKNPMREGRWPRLTVSTILLVLSLAAPFAFSGCGQTAKPVTPASANLVHSYFGSPFSVSASDLPKSVSTFDHSAGQIGVSSFVLTSVGQVPSAILNGTFVAAPTGFLNITENFATTSSGVINAQNPPVTGAWAVEIPGAGVLGNLLSVNTTGGGLRLTAAPVAMAENTACPIFSKATPFLYTTVPNATITNGTADYGGVDISTQGSAVTFNVQPYLIGRPTTLAPSAVIGGCSDTLFGALTAYPLNSFGSASNLELIALGESGFLVSSFTSNSGSSPGAFGGGTGVIGVAAPSSPVNVGSVIGAQYNGFIYAPQNSTPSSYDITVLASAFGDNTANSQACSPLQSSLVANNGRGAGTVATLPSANSLFGGEFLTTTGASAVNDPTGAFGSENCDMVIDLGIQDSMNNGLFPNATVFIGSNFPPFSASNPWNCFGTKLSCAVSFPAAAVVGQVQGQYVIFVVASAVSNPKAQLPNNSGNPVPQPVGIYLFQKSQ
jgi:hypothetical protein